MAKKASKILADGFLEFLPYLKPQPANTHFRCNMCFFVGDQWKTAKWHYRQNGKIKYGLIYRTGWYCEKCIWEVITQYREHPRYLRWQKKYLDAIQVEINAFHMEVIDADSTKD